MTHRDRKTTTLERQNPTHPNPPLNLDVIPVYDSELNAFDIRWDNPAILPSHTEWVIEGVNLYRSDISEFGPYFLLNDQPLGSTFYRDQTLNASVDQEDVSQSFVARGEEDEGNRWIFQVEKYPIVDPDSENVPTTNPEHVQVFIDGERVPVASVDGYHGQVEIFTAPYLDPATNETKVAKIPNEESVVTCSYSYNVNVVTNKLDRKVFYRATTVGYRKWDGVDTNGNPIPAQRLETPLEWTEAKTIHHMENMDYIWREAIRRNAWILDQGGERVWVFLRKWTGDRCSVCWDEQYQHARNDCRVCYGTGIEGGYEGPYEIKIAPQDGEKKVVFADHGFSIENIYQVWTGPSPMVSQRDFIVKQNNDRYSIGSVTMPSNRGNVLQQQFSINLLDSEDIRSKVPLNLPDHAYPESRVPTWDKPQVHKEGEEIPYQNNPVITDHEDVPDPIQERGRTVTYDNITKKS